MNRRVAPMWHVNNVLYHFHDEDRAKRAGEAKLVWVLIPSDYFIGTWQFDTPFNKAIYQSEKEAETQLAIAQGE